MALDRKFLSHLSGDEGAVGTGLSLLQFLSHLSGDEGRFVLRLALIHFLSHLSGDEVKLKTSVKRLKNYF